MKEARRYEKVEGRMGEVGEGEEGSEEVEGGWRMRASGEERWREDALLFLWRVLEGHRTGETGGGGVESDVGWPG